MKRILAACVVVGIVATAVHAERPPQFRKDAKLVVSGVIKKITSKEEAFGGDGVVTHYTAEVQVGTVDKGNNVKPGDSISASWFNVTKRPSKLFIGAYGHAYDIAANDKATFWLMERGQQDPPNVWVIIYSKDGVEKASQPAKLGTRESVAGMDNNHPTLVSYRKAVAEMKKLPASDPRSWQFQANMHGAPVKEGANDGWRSCMHGNWWFLPWHRGYIYYFERICRKMSGDDDLRLPYWGWESPGQNVLPESFRQPNVGGKANPLYDGTRLKAANQGGALRPPDQAGSFAADWQNVRQASQFTTSIASLSFGGVRTAKTAPPNKPASVNHGAMESQAHDLVHVVIGGGTGNMGDPKIAARDPIFWLHHANVDRLWNRWLDISGHHIPDPATDKDWYDQEFPFFDENGKKVTVSVSKILELAAAEARYDDDRRFLIAAQPPKGKQEPKLLAVGRAKPAQALTGRPFKNILELTEDTKPRLMAALNEPPTAAMPPAVLLRIEGIKPPKDTPVTYEVFLLKKGDMPSSKYYVGTISFFGRDAVHGHGDDKGFTQGFDVTRMAQRLQSANKGKLPELEIAIIPHSTAGLSAADLAKENIEIPVGTITLALVAVEKK